MQLNTYLHFNGQCEEAFKFYEQCLGGKIEAMVSHEETPFANQVPTERRRQIVHARLLVDGQVLMGMDPPPDRYQKPHGFNVNIGVKDPAEAERIFNALSQNGTVTMQFGETFFAVRFGMLVDRFGIPWMINCEKAAEKAA